MAWRVPTSPSILRSKAPSWCLGRYYMKKKNDPQCVHWTPDPSSPGQPRAGEQSLQIQETTGQMTGWAQPCGGDIPMGRGQEQGEMNLLYPLPFSRPTLCFATTPWRLSLGQDGSDSGVKRLKFSPKRQPNFPPKYRLFFFIWYINHAKDNKREGRKKLNNPLSYHHHHPQTSINTLMNFLSFFFPTPAQT